VANGPDRAIRDIYDPRMSTGRNGDVEIYFERFGDPSDPTLVLINGLGSQSINYPVEWCERFVAEGYQVARLDNRDTGLSSKLDGVDYAVTDMAEDVLAVLDAIGVDRAHVMGASMGGMIVQRLAIDHPDRLLTATSVMSRTGEPGFGDSSPEALAMLMAAPASSRDEHIEHHVAAIAVYGSKPEWVDEDVTRARAAAAYDRCFCPAGIGRQIAAVMRSPSRDEELRRVAVPVLVIHGSRDTLIDPSGGRHTAEVIPGARYVEIEGMGHDYPPAVWEPWVRAWSTFVADAISRR
jgi:pimeloyl-ACP methyl ester carboxylesterase